MQASAAPHSADEAVAPRAAARHATPASWRRGAAAAGAAAALCAAVVLLAAGGRTRAWGGEGGAAGRRVVLTDGVHEAEWGVQQAFATFAHNNDEEHPAVQQAYEFSANETARRRARVCDFIGDMGDVLGEMSTERAVEMIRRLDEVQGDAAWEEMKQKLLPPPAAEEAEEGGEEGGEEGAGAEEGAADGGADGGAEGAGARRRLLGRRAPAKRAPRPLALKAKGRKATARPVQSLQEAAAAGEETEGEEGEAEGGGEAAEGNTTSAEAAKPLTPRERLLAKFGCDLSLKRLPGFWGQWYFIGQMPAPLNQMSADGPTTDVAKMVPNVTKVSETIDFADQEAVNAVSEKIPPEAFAVKWTGEVRARYACMHACMRAYMHARMHA